MGNLSNSLLTLGASNLSSSNRQREDFYATDPKALEMLLEHESFSKDIWEPAAGTLWLSNVLSEHGHNVKNSNIVNRLNVDNFEIIDFLDYKETNTRDIITNPPYTVATDFVKHTLDISEKGTKIAMFLRLTFLEGQKRKKIIFDKEPPYRVYPFSKRVLVAKDGIFPKGSAVAYCWIVWIKGFKGNPEIVWL